MVEIKLIPVSEFQRINKTTIDKYARLSLLADMCRANTIASVKRAGSGHLGSSFSAMDIVTLLYYQEMNTVDVGIENPERDVYFSSKGHDVPGQYSVLFSIGVLPKDKFVRLRRLGGTYGHPDVSTPGMEANTGSLGMGISKGKGFAFAKRLRGQKGRVFIMTGDGELQEGQIYESLQSAVNQQLTNLTVIVDHNKLQSDKPVAEISNLGDLESKFTAFGWHFARCNGHDFNQLEKVFNEFREAHDKPKILIADTIKGRGVSFMEHPAALKAGQGYYRWHAGAPDDDSYNAAYEELITRINSS
ncbi:MAG TPA: transketolase, partial [Pyrinomonadaceae bacterium]|nr:transketolase [Pyrinomonadaceae bacterium]